MTIMDWMLIYLGLGVMLGLVMSLAMTMMGKRKWNLLMVNFEQRAGNRIAKVYKARKHIDKDNKTSYWVKPTVLFSGLRGLKLGKGTIMPPPEFADVTLLEGGGNLMVSYSPAPNIFLPVQMKIDAKKMEMVVKFEILKTWFKTAMVGMIKNKLLRPELKWEKVVPIAMGGMLIIFMVMMIIVMQSVPDSMGSITDTFAGFVTRLEGATGSMSGVVTQTGTAIS